MAKAVTFTAIDPAGITHTRTSKTKTYSHCVMARRDYDYDMMIAERPEGYNDRKNYAFYVKQSKLDVEAELAAFPWMKRERVIEGIERHQDIIAKHPTVESYIKALRDARIKKIWDAREAGEYDNYMVLGWQSRADLAIKECAKAHNSDHLIDVYIAEVQVKG